MSIRQHPRVRALARRHVGLLLRRAKSWANVDSALRLLAEDSRRSVAFGRCADPLLDLLYWQPFVRWAESHFGFAPAGEPAKVPSAPVLALVEEYRSGDAPPRPLLKRARYDRLDERSEGGIVPWSDEAVRGVLSGAPTIALLPAERRRRGRPRPRAADRLRARRIAADPLPRPLNTAFTSPPRAGSGARVGGGSVTSTTPDSLASELRTPTREAAAATQLEPVEIVDYHPSLWQTLKESYRSRHLIWHVAVTALNAYFVKYRLGPTWIIVNTFMGVIGWSLIGGKVANFHAPNGMPYWLYTMVGLMGWQLFQSTLVISARSFLRLRSLIKEVYFPLILVPIAGSSQALVRFFLMFITYVIAVTYYWFHDGSLLRAARAEVPVLLGGGPTALRHARLGDQPLDGAADGAHARRPDADPVRDAVPVLRHADPLPDRTPAREDAPDRRAQPAVLAGRDGQDRPHRRRVGANRGGGLEPVRDPRGLRVRASGS